MPNRKMDSPLRTTQRGPPKPTTENDDHPSMGGSPTAFVFCGGSPGKPGRTRFEDVCPGCLVCKDEPLWVFAAHLLPALTNPFALCRSEPWLLFGRVVEAMAEKGWRWSAQRFRTGSVRLQVSFSHDDVNGGRAGYHETCIATAALRAAREAIGGQDE